MAFLYVALVLTLISLWLGHPAWTLFGLLVAYTTLGMDRFWHRQLMVWTALWLEQLLARTVLAPLTRVGCFALLACGLGVSLIAFGWLPAPLGAAKCVFRPACLCVGD